MRAVLWRGISRLDGRTPILLLANGPSHANPKTGPMLQTWIVRADMDPRDALRDANDVGICGDCSAWHYCYVRVHQAPTATWRAYQRGRYRDLTSRADRRAAVRALPVRAGAYGDPAAVPVHVWDDLCGAASRWTGYTHQWRDGFALADLFMASTETDADTDRAASEGWRAFQIVADTSHPRAGSMLCPHTATQGRVTCAVCGQCNGGTGRHIVNPIHGARARFALPVLQA